MCLPLGPVRLLASKEEIVNVAPLWICCELGTRSDILRNSSSMQERRLITRSVCRYNEGVAVVLAKNQYFMDVLKSRVILTITLCPTAPTLFYVRSAPLLGL